MARPNLLGYRINYLYYLAHVDNMPSIHRHVCFRITALTGKVMCGPI